jgi:hypothetical protein
MRRIHQFVAAIMFGTLGLCATPAQAQPSIRVSPGSSVYSASQGMDLVILLEGLGGLGVIGGQVLFDDNDITGPVVALFRQEGLATGIALRSPHVPMGFLGLGTHTFRVTVTLSDGSQLQAGAVWQVLR